MKFNLCFKTILHKLEVPSCQTQGKCIFKLYLLCPGVEPRLPELYRVFAELTAMLDTRLLSIPSEKQARLLSHCSTGALAKYSHWMGESIAVDRYGWNADGLCAGDSLRRWLDECARVTPPYLQMRSRNQNLFAVWLSTWVRIPLTISYLLLVVCSLSGTVLVLGSYLWKQK